LPLSSNFCRHFAGKIDPHDEIFFEHAEDESTQQVGQRSKTEKFDDDFGVYLAPRHAAHYFPRLEASRKLAKDHVR
jgi:hypothetical protein